ncbi:MAG: glycosyltransferase [bacterium]|nr:glycosyltransferase [bacterium]
MKTLIIIPLHNKIQFLIESLSHYAPPKGADLLIIDDASTDNTSEQLEKEPWIQCIKRDMELGYGAVFINGYEYARDMGYDCMITLDPESDDFSKELPPIFENLAYGYDIVTSSRVLENYHYKEIPENYIKITEDIAADLKEITEFDITDPLSSIKGYRIKSMENMELTDDTHGILLQVWVQAFYFGLTVIEIPAQSDSVSGIFGTELDEYEEPEGLLLSILETEKYLYNKGSLN